MTCVCKPGSTEVGFFYGCSTPGPIIEEASGDKGKTPPNHWGRKYIFLLHAQVLYRAHRWNTTTTLCTIAMIYIFHNNMHHAPNNGPVITIISYWSEGGSFASSNTHAIQNPQFCNSTLTCVSLYNKQLHVDNNVRNLTLFVHFKRKNSHAKLNKFTMTPIDNTSLHIKIRQMAEKSKPMIGKNQTRAPCSCPLHGNRRKARDQNESKHCNRLHK